jgi:hypothetical protein
MPAKFFTYKTISGSCEQCDRRVPDGDALCYSVAEAGRVRQ